jgi:hypothetical protein
VKRTSSVAAAAILLAVGLTMPAFARPSGGGSGMSATSTGNTPPGWSHGNKTGWGSGTTPPGLRNRSGTAGTANAANSASNPPGWSHGRKTGWGTGTMPPGLMNR